MKIAFYFIFSFSRLRFLQCYGMNLGPCAEAILSAHKNMCILSEGLFKLIGLNLNSPCSASRP